MKKAAFCAIFCTLFTLTSCIYEAPDDNFYRTLWTCEEEELGKITIEFLCGNQISVKASEAIGSFGTYYSDGNTATFSGLTLRYNNRTIIIEDGTKNADRLTINWHISTSRSANFTTLRRLSAYE